MNTVTRSAWITIAAVSALLLAGCTTTAGSTTAAGGESTEQNQSGDGGGDTGSGDACPVVPGFEYFSDSSVTLAPEPGQAFGDGTAITFNAPEEYYATYDLYYVNEDGEAFENSAGVFDNEAPDGVYTTTSLVFGSEANNRPGILELTTVYFDGLVLDTPDPAYVDGVSIVTLGRYCLTLKSE